ncbi:glyoxylase-like metal-dependent hydrolase (beta-lactamase superfamily II) [Ereboglobus sp. PH5-5]|uniref:MBL fold metallo-hydrolase n=1 Tax=unclassified Ereboglobus TaxID=2626932 RepID=UPI002404B915|nr:MULTISPECIES: MBL fold metallo-hydrolase [unclassified Ereboglobus]MDF9826139.1 glyoxylase-like metal-dependent hydrolase (beta-lactamase superfamily II) [Ereboglobus sp. PH5-10]MDF9832152.1 glyoxylase-like metal-dependent hydrolase (beta-lactamase superfamily II) [Ereboglobus sp. PH5-5]
MNFKIPHHLAALALTFIFAAPIPVVAQTPAKQPADTQRAFSFIKKSDAMLQEQARVIFNQARKVFAAHPPSATPSDERLLAFYALDSLFHDTRLDKGEAFTEFMEDTAKRVAATLAGPKPASGLRIIRFYNHGFILQTPTVTIAIDIVRGGKRVITGIEEEPYLDLELMRPIIERCDALFVSHPHNDHADLRVAKLFIEAGKPVVAPPGLWTDVSPLITHPRAADATEPIDFTVALRSLKTPLAVRVYPGHQGKVPNNLYAITTPEGKTILHSGDQTGGGADLPKLLKIREQIRVDVFLPQCWMARLPLVVEGVAPALVLTGHENEMGHTIDHRESYWQCVRRVQKLSAPVILTAWGEHVDIP